jgi:hypothetical protein
MALNSDVAALFFSTIYMVLQLVTLTELTLYHRYNGPILIALRLTFGAFALIVAFPLLARLDALIDISPGWDFRAALAETVWGAYAVACIPSGCLWWSLHTEHRRRKR